MFYRIKDEKIYDYADYEYDNACLYSDICTMNEFQQNPDIYELNDGTLELVANYQELIAQKRKEQFEREFFKTSLGWIRRQVSMKDGSKKEFLADLLLTIKAGMELGQDVKIITYKTPDFSKEPTLYYIESLQEVKSATPKFIQECLFQTVQDFGGGIGIVVNNEMNDEAINDEPEIEGGDNGI